MRARLVFLLAVPIIAGCGGGDDTTGAPSVSDVACGAIIDGGPDAASMTAALGQAKAGDCVVGRGVRYEGSFVVPASVKLLSAVGVTAAFGGGTDVTPVLELIASTDSLIERVNVVDAAGVGILVHDAGRVASVTVTNAAKAALVAQGVASSSGSVGLDQLELTSSGVGLFVQGAHVVVQGRTIANNNAVSLLSSMGVVALGGATLELTSTTIQGNGIGVVVDGASGTTAKFVDVRVLDNADRGVWVQNLAGTLQAPALHIEGVQTRIEGNGACGLGALASAGIVLSGAAVKGTVMKPIASDLGTVEEVGDGIVLASGTGDTLLDGVTAEDNARAQVLISGGGSGISIKGGNIAVGKGQYEVVVQDTTATVDVAPELISSAPKLSACGAGISLGQ